MQVNHYASFVLRTEPEDVKGFQGNIPILLTPTLYKTHYGSIVHLLLEIFDQPTYPFPLRADRVIRPGRDDQIEVEYLLDNPYQFETVAIISEPVSRENLLMLADQEEIPLHFFDMNVNHLLSKTLTHSIKNRLGLEKVIHEGIAHDKSIPEVDIEKAMQVWLINRKLMENND